MAFMDKLGEIAKTAGEKAGDLAKSATEKAGDLAETAKLNSQISGQRKKIAEIKEELAEHYWRRFKSGEELGDEQAISLCKLIALSEDEITALEAKKPS
ncbi:MAG: hypothetical protein LBS10_11805 [Gracilibacteraceae bacterium]|jgi:hypothetical protein|nr:hypothetical protein [Gracilibacteraceae bacterium]